jgi:uncharacterized protein YaaQ
MTRIAFIGLGNMGGGMAANQAKAQHHVMAFDLSAGGRAGRGGGLPCGGFGGRGGQGRRSGDHHAAGRSACALGLWRADPGPRAQDRLLLDCSTIDVDSARAVAKQAGEAGFRFADAPVSGGIMAAEAGTLAFMVGCDTADFAEVEAALEPMSRVTIHAGDHGAGQAAKICNNMLLGVSMIGTCEAFALAEKLGLGGGPVLRNRQQVVGPVLVGLDLLPGAGRRAFDAGRSPVRGRVRHGDDAEGPETGPGGRRQGGSLNADGSPGRGALRPAGRQWIRRKGLLGDDPDAARTHRRPRLICA